ncbi:MAG: type IV pilus twitching motility protein PilT [Gammaproteobacteria bacterium]
MNIHKLLRSAVEYSASDLHISAHMPPMIRVEGELKPLTDFPVLDHKAICSFLTEEQRQKYEKNRSLDFALEIPNLSRFRVNIFQHSRGIAGAFRVIANEIRSLKALGLPEIFKDFCQYPHGLVLVTGPTGSGKTTTLAAMMDYINQSQPYHILTIEDPIEFIHTSKKSLVHQRELYRDTINFNTALHAALREDPDVILIGELRDLETIRLALTAAETGHLVFATLHTSSAAKTISRLVDVFPGNEKSMVRMLLAETLQAVIAQTLVKKIAGGRTPVFETMVCTPAIRHLIREDKPAQLYSMIQTGGEHGMRTREQHLKELQQAGVISG